MSSDKEIEANRLADGCIVLVEYKAAEARQDALREAAKQIKDEFASYERVLQILEQLGARDE